MVNCATSASTHTTHLCFTQPCSSPTLASFPAAISQPPPKYQPTPSCSQTLHQTSFFWNGSGSNSNEMKLVIYNFAATKHAWTGGLSAQGFTCDSSAMAATIYLHTHQGLLQSEAQVTAIARLPKQHINRNYTITLDRWPGFAPGSIRLSYKGGILSLCYWLAPTSADVWFKKGRPYVIISVIFQCLLVADMVLPWCRQGQGLDRRRLTVLRTKMFSWQVYLLQWLVSEWLKWCMYLTILTLEGFVWLCLTIKLDISLVAQFCILMRNLGHVVYVTFHDTGIVKVTGRGHDLDCLRSDVESKVYSNSTNSLLYARVNPHYSPYYLLVSKLLTSP